MEESRALEACEAVIGQRLPINATDFARRVDTWSGGKGGRFLFAAVIPDFDLWRF